MPILPDPCAGAKVLISSIGVAGCVEALGYGVGAGYTWGGGLDGFTGCDLSPWRPVEPTGARAAAATALQYIDVPGGLPAAAWQIRGAGGVAPDVTVTGPAGRAVTRDQRRPLRAQRAIHGVPVGRRQHVHHGRRPAGRVVDDRQRRLGPDHPRARGGRAAQAVGVGLGHGLGAQARAALARQADQGPGRAVRRARQGLAPRHRDDEPVRAARSAFAPGVGSGGVRKIEAIVEQDRHPRTTLTVAHYRAPGMPKPARVRHLKLTRRGTRLIVSWRTPGSFRHAVYLAATDGRRLLSFAAAGKRTVTFAAIPSTVGATATVTGLTRGNAKGPAAKASVKPVKPKQPKKPKTKAKKTP